jgi:serine/threonine protein kinase
MACVWVARLRGRHGFEKLVAIKTILPKYADNPRFRKMFLDEADIASRIEHPNVAQVFDLGEERGILYLVMEYIDGDSLSKLNRACQKKGVMIPVGVALRVLADACAGLHEAHELTSAGGAPLGVVHRDISPHNILVSTKGIVKLIDFGIVKVGREDARGGETAESGLLKGKIQYMAPEQALGRPIDRRADVWAIGAILYHVLSGRAPYEGANQLAIMHLLGAGMPPLPLGPEVEPAVAAVAAKALAHDPAKRYATAAELREAIENAMAIENLTTTSSQVSAFWAEHLAERAQRRRTAIENALAAVTDKTGSEAAQAAASLVHAPRTQPPSDPPTTASYATLGSAALDTSGPAASFAKARKPVFTLLAIAAALGIVAATSVTVLNPKRVASTPAAAGVPAPRPIASTQPAPRIEAPASAPAPETVDTVDTVEPLALPRSNSPEEPDTSATGIRHKAHKPKVEP